MKWFCTWCTFNCIVYVVLLCYYLLMDSKNVILQDVIIGVFCLQVNAIFVHFNQPLAFQTIICRFSLEFEAKVIPRTPIFMPTSDFKNEIKFYTCLNYIGWLLCAIVIVTAKFSKVVQPKFIQHLIEVFLPNFAKYVYKFGFFLVFLEVHYLGMTQANYYFHAVLHNHFQMRILAKSLKRGMFQYQYMSFERKLYSKRYQLQMKRLLIRTIQEFRKIKKYYSNISNYLNLTVDFSCRSGNEIASTYNKIAPLYLLISIMIVCVALESALFVSVCLK